MSKYNGWNETRRKAAKRYRRRNRSFVNSTNAERNRKRKQRDPIGVLLTNTKSRAKKSGLSFNLTRADIIIPLCCPVFGFELKFSQSKVTNNTPSLDRTIPEKGYVSGNVRVISMRANLLKNNASKEELQKLLDYMKSNE